MTNDRRPSRTQRAGWMRCSLFSGVLAIAAMATGACGGGDDGAGSGAAGSGTAGSGTAGSGTAGSGTAGSGTAGSGTAGSGTAGTSAGKVCEPGLTRECVGDGACKGGQACRDDGSGWGVCKCSGGGGGAGEGGSGDGGAGGGAGDGGSGAGGGAGEGGAGGGSNGGGGQAGGGGASTTGSCDVPEGTLICTGRCGVPLAQECPQPFAGLLISPPPGQPGQLTVTAPTSIVLAATDENGGGAGCIFQPFARYFYTSGKTFRVRVNAPWRVTTIEDPSACFAEATCAKFPPGGIVVLLPSDVDRATAPLALVTVDSLPDCPQ